MSILQRIKNGKKNYKEIEFPGTDDKIAIVVLSSEDTMGCKIKADEYIQKYKIEDELYRDVVLQQHLAFEFLRDKDNRENKLANSIDEFKKSVDNIELAYFINQYNSFVQETSPFLNAVTDEQYEALKKTLEMTKLSDLSGESLLSLRSFLMSLV